VQINNHPNPLYKSPSQLQRVILKVTNSIQATPAMDVKGKSAIVSPLFQLCPNYTAKSLDHRCRLRHQPCLRPAPPLQILLRYHCRYSPDCSCQSSSRSITPRRRKSLLQAYRRDGLEAACRSLPLCRLGGSRSP